MGIYQFYFPKRFYKRYEELGYDFNRVCWGEEVDVRPPISMPRNLKSVWNWVLRHIKDATVALYCGADEGGDIYLTIEPRFKWVASRIFTTHLIFKYIGEFEIVNELNKLYERGVLVHVEEVDKKLSVSKSYSISKAMVVFSREALGCLNKVNEYFNVIDRSILFSWMFCKWVIEFGDCYPWLKEGHIAVCQSIYHLHLNPIVEEVLRRVEEIVREADRFKTAGDFGLSVYEIFNKYEVVDVDVPTLDVCQVVLACGKSMGEFKDVVYELWKKGVLEPVEDGCFTFNSKGVKMPRRFRLKKK